jgi:hypothetical protein
VELNLPLHLFQAIAQEAHVLLQLPHAAHTDHSHLAPILNIILKWHNHKNCIPTKNWRINCLNNLSSTGKWNHSRKINIYMKENNKQTMHKVWDTRPFAIPFKFTTSPGNLILHKSDI